LGYIIDSIAGVQWRNIGAKIIMEEILLEIFFMTTTNNPPMVTI